MSTFKEFSDVITQQFNKMSKQTLYRTGADKEVLWTNYLAAFPEGSNPMYIERTEHDCNFCSQFIKRIGNVVTIIDNKLISVWDVKIGGDYQIVANALSEYVKATTIKNIFLHNEKTVSKAYNNQLLKDGSIKKWNHFHCEIPDQFVERDLATRLSKIVSIHQIFQRGLNELTSEAIAIVQELIEQKSIYRGEEHLKKVNEFAKLKTDYNKLKKDEEQNIFQWANIKNPSAGIRNSVIGSLLQDISEGVELEKAVKSFENKVAPTNYKRNSKLVTTSMRKRAFEEVQALGLEDSLYRRCAVPTDIAINDVLFADRSTSKVMKGSVEDVFMSGVKSSTKSFDKIEEITIEDFVTKIVPKVTTIEVLLENKLTSSLVTLVAPVDPNAPNLLQWNNSYSWSYNGDVTSSMREQVKAAGGKVDGAMRFSIRWNEQGDEPDNDLDAHCYAPENNHIYFGNMLGLLDVDITQPGSKVAVENIIWQKPKNGVYKFKVKNYANTNLHGFTAEIELNKVLHEFTYNKSIPVNNYIDVAEVTFENEKFTLDTKLSLNTSSKEIWGIETETFQKVSMLMLSPNHWKDAGSKGNKHYFFMLHDAVNPDKVRGIYNEFLRPDLHEHRKTMEMVGDKMKCEITDHQLSGIGMNSDTNKDLIVKVTGSFNRTLRIKF